MLKKKSKLSRENYFWRDKEIGEFVHLADKDELGEKVRFCSIVKMKQGEKVDYHQHCGEKVLFCFPLLALIIKM